MTSESHSVSHGLMRPVSHGLTVSLPRRGETHETETNHGTQDEWHARLRAQLAEATERRARIKALREQLSAARNAGKALRHARRLRRSQ